ncbi:MAG TPA: energy-coupling factor transporter transmembrane component T, partial [Bacilli bacterium]|nr:energy-coupling factor transporter transmembrane component T [Bacilli bacterium]
VFNEVMTADKFYYLFGRVAPTITLVLTMGLRFIPLMVKQMRNIEEGQKGLGLLTQTSFLKKLKHYLRMFSILLTWSLEHALETADAMKSRGYGLKPRTSFSSFSFHRQDLGSLIYLLLFFSIVVSGEFLNIYASSFFPNLSNFQFGIRELIGYLSFSLLGIFPLILVIKEALIWRYWMLKM